MIKPLFTLLFLSLPILASSQITELEVRRMVRDASEQELVIECSRMLQEDYFYFAEIIVDKLLKFNPQSSNYHYRKGFIVLDSRLDYETAMPHLFMAIKSTKKNYDMYSANEESAAVDAYYHLARCYHLDYQLEEAKKYYQMFIDNSSKKSELIPQAELRLLQCDVAKELVNKPKNAIVRNIESPVNTNDPEYSPSISLDGKSLYFTSRRRWQDSSTDIYKDPKLNQYPEDIFVSYIDENRNFSDPEMLEFAEARINEASVSVSSDEKKIYVYKDQDGYGDLYYSDFKKQKFEELFHIKNDNINTKFWETHCTVTRDGLQMYFVSSRPGGFGGRDIYRIVKLPNGEWSEPINLGPEINTAYDEDCPFIAVDNKTLYYSSNGKTSMGGFDIFMTIRDENDVWSTSLNLGFPINSTGDDVFYTTTADGLRGYLSSYRKGGQGEKDIYEIENDYLGIKSISLLKGEFRMTDGSPVGNDVVALLSCENCNDANSMGVDLRIKSGSFFSALDRCKDYTLRLYADSGQRLLKTEKFTTLCNDQNETIERIVYVPNYTLAGTVADDKTLEWIEGAIITMNETGNENIISEFNSDSLGAFVSNYLQDKNLGDRISLEFHISKQDYLTQTFKLDTVLGKFSHIQLDYLLAKDEAGIDLAKVLNLNPIYFDLDKSNIRSDAAIELDKIVVIMNENPDIKIELGSHTDCRASYSYNMKLSDRRAKSSAQYIRERISTPERIYGKGYGESKLVNDCGCEGDIVSDCSEEEHQLNRRTEFVIVK